MEKMTKEQITMVNNLISIVAQHVENPNIKSFDLLHQYWKECPDEIFSHVSFILNAHFNKGKK